MYKHGRKGTGTCIARSRVDTNKTGAYHIIASALAMMSIVYWKCCHQRAFQLRQVGCKFQLISPSTPTHDHRTYQFFSPRPSSYKFLLPLPRVPVRLCNHVASPAEPNSEATNNVAHMHTRGLVTPSQQQQSSIVVALSPTVLEDDVPSGPHNSKNRPTPRISEASGSLSYGFVPFSSPYRSQHAQIAHPRSDDSARTREPCRNTLRSLP